MNKTAEGEGRLRGNPTFKETQKGSLRETHLEYKGPSWVRRRQSACEPSGKEWNCMRVSINMGFPGGGSDSKVSACNAGDWGSIPGLGRSPGGGRDNPLQYSCLENSMDRGGWWATVHGVAKSQKQRSD